MATPTLSATPRDGTGTGVARKLRQAGKVPGIIYGHGREPQALAVDNRDFEKLLSQINAASTVIELSLDGHMSRTLIREIQRHPFKRQLMHVDFQELVAGEKVSVSVPLPACVRPPVPLMPVPLKSVPCVTLLLRLKTRVPLSVMALPVGSAPTVPPSPI